MIRDQTQMMKHNASLLSRRVVNGQKSTVAPNILHRSQYGGMGHVGLTSLDNTVSVEGSFCPGVRVGQSEPSSPQLEEMGETRRTARKSINDLEKTMPVRQVSEEPEDLDPHGATKLLRPQ